MTLEDLTPGEKVTIEVVWGSIKYEIPTVVMGAQATGVLVKPFIYNGNYVDLGAKQYKDMVYNMHVVDKKKENRFAWRNVQIETKELRGEKYYAVKTNTFAKLGVSSERRVNKRMLLDIPAQITIDGRNIQGTLHDISDSGISFKIPKDIVGSCRIIKVQFTDVAREEEFFISLDCDFVRRIEQGPDELWGCKLRNASKSLFNYVFMKRSDLSYKLI